jgi:ornithine cyclodeaminase/alanine dehydrogenase-like protein (mu-crystallin family)
VTRLEKEFLYLSYDDTVKLGIRMKDVAPVFEEAYRILAEQDVRIQARVRLVYPPLKEGKGTGRPWTHDLRVLPAIIPGMGTACRLGATAHGAGGGGVILNYWDFETMSLQCVISDALVHGVRSAAPDAPLTRYCAREDASTLAMIGTGRIARWAAEAVWSQRPIKVIKVYSRDRANRLAFCEYIETRLMVEAQECTSSDQAVEGADIVAMATATRTPVINGAAISPGTTVISNTPEELDAESVRRAARIVATMREDVMDHIPPIQAVDDAIQAGQLDPERDLVTIADVITGRAVGRKSDDEIVVCVNPGNGVHDVAVAKFTYERALQKGVGTRLPV